MEMMSVVVLNVRAHVEHTEAAEYSEQVKRRAHLLLGNPSLLAHWLTLGSGIQTHTGIN